MRFFSVLLFFCKLINYILKTEDNETYYIHFIQETEFSEEDDEYELPLATEEQIEAYEN